MTCTLSRLQSPTDDSIHRHFHRVIGRYTCWAPMSHHRLSTWPRKFPTSCLEGRARRTRLNPCRTRGHRMESFSRIGRVVHSNGPLPCLSIVRLSPRKYVAIAAFADLTTNRSDDNRGLRLHNSRTTTHSERHVGNPKACIEFSKVLSSSDSIAPRRQSRRQHGPSHHRQQPPAVVLALSSEARGNQHRIACRTIQGRRSDRSNDDQVNLHGNFIEINQSLEGISEPRKNRARHPEVFGGSGVRFTLGETAN